MSFLNKTKVKYKKHHIDDDDDKSGLIIALTMLLSVALVFVSVFAYQFYQITLIPDEPDLDMDNLDITINQRVKKVYYSPSPSPSSATRCIGAPLLSNSPHSAASTELIFSHEFDSNSGLTSVDNLVFDTTYFVESTASLKINATNTKQYAQPVNVTVGATIDYDETAELSFFYYIDMWKNYNPANQDPYLNVFIEVGNESNVNKTLGFFIYGLDRTVNDGQFDGTTFPIPDIWFDFSTNTYAEIWSMFYINNLRTYLDQVSGFVHTDSSVTIHSIKIFAGDDSAIGTSRTEYFLIDYLRIMSKPIDATGGIWYDETNQVVASYEIETNFTIIAFEGAFDIDTVVNSPMKLFIYDYLFLDRVLPAPETQDIVDDLLVYMTMIDIEGDTSVTITPITYNGTSAFQINGTRTSNFIPLQDNKAFGTRLQYRFNANYTAIAQQIDGEWASDSLEERKWLNPFTLNLNSSILVV